MAQSTIYDVKLRYMLEDRATKGMTRMRQETERVASSSKRFRKDWASMQAGINMARTGIRFLSKHMINFNSDSEQAKVTMAGMIMGWQKGNFNQNLKRASDLVDALQERARTGVGATADFVNMAEMIVGPVSAAGLSMKELEEITTGATVAAKAYRVQTEVAGRDIEAALIGQLGKKDIFLNKVLGPMMRDLKLTTEEFNKLSAAKRAALVTKGFEQDWLKQMAKAQAGTFAGAMSTFQESLQRFMGKVGLPLFKALTKEVQSWNTWIDQNTDKVSAFADQLAKSLVDAFRMMKDIAAFFVRHSGTLIMVAKAVVGWKIGAMVGGGISAAGGMLGGGIGGAGKAARYLGFKKAGKTTMGFGTKLAGATGVIGRFIPALGAATLALGGIGKIMSFFKKKVSDMEKQEKARKAQERKYAAKDVLGRSMKTGEVRRSLKTMERVSEAKRKGYGAFGKEREAYKAAMRKKWEKGPGRIASQVGTKKVQREMFNRWWRDAEIGREGGTPEQMDPEDFPREMGGMRAQAQADFNKEFADATIHAASLKTEIKAHLDLSIRTLEQQKMIDSATGAMSSDAEILGNIRATENATARGKLKADRDMLFELQNHLQLHKMTGGEIKKRLEAYRKGEYIPYGLWEPSAAKVTKPTAELGGRKPRINVTIQKIEVQSDDPDRFAFGLVSAFKDLAKSPSAAAHVLPEG